MNSRPQQPSDRASYGHLRPVVRHSGITVAQVLLTHDDLQNRTRHLNAHNTLATLLARGAIPIINENDTVAVDEIKFGDNDRLGALTATSSTRICSSSFRMWRGYWTNKSASWRSSLKYARSNRWRTVRTV